MLDTVARTVDEIPQPSDPLMKHLQPVSFSLAVIDMMPAEVAVLDAAGTIVAVNRAWRRFAERNGGGASTHGVGLNYLTIADAAAAEDPLYAGAAAAGIRRVLRAEQDVFEMEYPCHSPEQHRWFRLVASPAPLGTQCGAVVMHVDVTEQHRAEEALHLLMTRARCLLWHADVTLEPDGLNWRIRVVDEVAAEQFLPIARRPGESYTDAWYASKLPDDNEEMECTAKQAILSGQAEYAQRFRCRCADGSIRWLYEDVRVEPVSEGSWRCVGVCTDITQAVAAEEAGRRADARYRALIQHSSDVVLLVDSSGIITYASPSVYQVLGYTT
jgi:PAS domain-containing protein